MDANAGAVATGAPALGVSRSFAGRTWQLKTVDPENVRRLVHAAAISPLLAELLSARGVTPETLEDALRPTLKRLMPEPFLLSQMERAVIRTADAIEAQQAIAVFGDYDVDGSCSAALLHGLLSVVGPPPRLYVPDRLSEGYGPSRAALLKLAAEGAKLIVTVDCGATANDALSAAADAGVDVIVLDHHAVAHAVNAYAQVNPNQASDTSGLGHLCAAGVVFLFAVALNRELRNRGYFATLGVAEPDLREHLDLVALATVCDVVPLIGVNRAFVRAGLARLSALDRKGAASLARIARTEPPFTAYHLGFVLGPRINAGGRVGRCSLGVELLTSSDDKSADDIAALLDLHNRERQALEKLIVEEAIVLAASQSNAAFIFASQEGWHPGVVGIVAGRLKERYGKPAFVAGFEGGLGRGSARSIAGIDIGVIIRAAVAEGHLISGGGHAMAAGFSLTVDMLEGFARFLSTSFEGTQDALAQASVLMIDGFTSAAGATIGLVEEIALAGPFGAGNPEPLLALPDMRVSFADRVGKHHIRLRLSGGDGAVLDAISFRSADEALGRALLSARGTRIHAVGRLRVDEWNGRRRVQLHLEDAAPAGA